MVPQQELNTLVRVGKKAKWGVILCRHNHFHFSFRHGHGGYYFSHSQVCHVAMHTPSPQKAPAFYEYTPADLMRSAGAYFCDQVCKPGSVFCSHLSRRTVADTLQPPPRDDRAGLMCPSTALLRIEFTASFRLRTMGELLPRLSTLTALLRRYISVALVLRLPSAGVTRYPCPVEPGLSSRTGFRLVPAAAWPGR